MKKIVIAIFALTFMFAGATFKVAGITATDTGYDIQLDYMSDEAIGGYQFNFLSSGEEGSHALTLTGGAGGARYPHMRAPAPARRQAEELLRRSRANSQALPERQQLTAVARSAAWRCSHAAAPAASRCAQWLVRT